jgi:two-component system response regulator HydG
VSEKSRILVVDDNEDFCRGVTDILELHNYEVVCAYDGLKGLELIKENGFGLVLMDIKMPVMDGVETYKKVKEITPATPVIMVTAHATEDLIREALREGAFGSLRKPLDFDRLFELIERAIARRSLILVVDDDRNLCSNLENILTDEGYRVAVAYNGDMAVRETWENKFDIVIVDMKLPPLTGLETYLSIRDIRPDAVVIIITGYATEMRNQIEQATEKNAYTCMEKPINMDKLLSILEQIEEQKTKGIIQKPEQS